MPSTVITIQIEAQIAVSDAASRILDYNEDETFLRLEDQTERVQGLINDEVQRRLIGDMRVLDCELQFSRGSIDVFGLLTITSGDLSFVADITAVTQAAIFATRWAVRRVLTQFTHPLMQVTVQTTAAHYAIPQHPISAPRPRVDVELVQIFLLIALLTLVALGLGRIW